MSLEQRHILQRLGQWYDEARRAKRSSELEIERLNEQQEDSLPKQEREIEAQLAQLRGKEKRGEILRADLMKQAEEEQKRKQEMKRKDDQLVAGCGRITISCRPKKNYGQI